MEDIEIGYILFTDGYDADGNPTHKQEFITYKSKCEELTKTNKALKDRWSKLKDLLKSIDNANWITRQGVLRVMEELEQGEKNGTEDN